MITLTECKITSFSDPIGAWAEKLGFGSIAVSWLNPFQDGTAKFSYPHHTRIDVTFIYRGKEMLYRGIVQDIGRGYCVNNRAWPPEKWFDLWLPEIFQVLDENATVTIHNSAQGALKHDDI